MRRLLAINLTVVLLAPWIAALSGAAIPIVPCPMHRSAEPTAGSPAAAMVGVHPEGAEHQSGSHHGTTARGCNCAGECGRSGAAFSIPAEELVSAPSIARAAPVAASEGADFVFVTHSLQFATGPPERLLT
jgi:hypothetical protein